MIKFSYQFQGTSAKAQIVDGEQVLDMFPTYVGGDPITVLASAVIELMRASYHGYPIIVRRSWENEPGEWRWVFEREQSTLKIRVLWFDQSFSKQDDEQ